MMHRHQRPIRNHARNTHSMRILFRRLRTRNQILDRRRIEQLDIRELQHLTQQRGREQRSMFDNDKVALVLVLHANLVQEQLRGLAHHHCAEELAA